MTAIERIAEFTVKGCQVDDLAGRSAIIEAVSDVFGCILAGSGSVVAVRAQNAFAEIGAGTAPLYGTGKSLSPAFAAMVNAIAGHAYDFDDSEEAGNTHPSVVLVPALLAAASLEPTSGEALLTAYTTGFEVIARLGEAISLDHYARGFHSTATLGAIGATAAVANLLKLNVEQATHALALSVSQAVGYTCQFGSNAKPAQAGLAAKSGLLSAFMAQAGMTGQAHALESPRGMNGHMGAGTEQSFAHALAKLGRSSALNEYGILIKAWPSCGYTHRLMACAMELRETGGFDAADIVEIHATMLDFHKAILPFSKPENFNEAMFSAQACTAQALVQGNLTLADLAGRFWENRRVARLTSLIKVKTEKPHSLELKSDTAQADRLEVHMNSGKVLSAQCSFPPGHPQNPLNHNQLEAKFNNITGGNSSNFDKVLSWPDACDVAAHFQSTEQST